MDKKKIFILDNGWEVYLDEDGSFMLHVIPIPNNIFQIDQRVKISEEIYNAIADGERNVKELFGKFKLHNYIIKWRKDDRPKPDYINTDRRFYGIGYVVVEKDNKYFMEYLLSTQGGGSRKIEINKEIYLRARGADISSSVLFREFDLYKYDRPEFNVKIENSYYNPIKNNDE